MIIAGIVLLIFGLILLIGIPVFNYFGHKEPEVKRKWTDPSLKE